MNRRIQSTIATVLMVSLVGTAQAGLIADRERIAAYLQKEEVVAELARHGITQEQAKARVAALSDEEAASIAGRIEELPAGGMVPIAALGMAALVVAALPVIAVGAVVLGVVAIASAINRSSTRSGSTPSASLPQQPAYSPRVPFQQGAVDSSAFPTSSGLYGAQIPAGGR